MTQQTAPDWREQEAVVYGRRRPLAEVDGGRLYHGSPVELAVGTVIEPGHGRNHQQSAEDAVSITSDLRRAIHWAREAAGGADSFVYEVEPLGPVDVWRVAPCNQGQNIRLWEARTPKARVVSVLPVDRIREPCPNACTTARTPFSGWATCCCPATPSGSATG